MNKVTEHDLEEKRKHIRETYCAGSNRAGYAEAMTELRVLRNRYETQKASGLVNNDLN